MEMNTTSWTETITIGELSTSHVRYSPWTGSIVLLLADAGLGWVTKHLLIRDVDVDFAKGTIRVSIAALGYEPGASVFDITITITPNKEV